MFFFFRKTLSFSTTNGSCFSCQRSYFGLLVDKRVRVYINKCACFLRYYLKVLMPKKQNLACFITPEITSSHFHIRLIESAKKKPYSYHHTYFHFHVTCNVASSNRSQEFVSLRKHAYSNTFKISPPKTESFQTKILIFFHISAQNIDCGYSLESPRRGGSNEYPQSMFLSRNQKNNVYPCKPQFYYIKVGFKGVKIT